MVVLCNLLVANKTSEFPRHSHNAIRQTGPSLTCTPYRAVSSTEQIWLTYKDLISTTKNLPKISKSVGRPELKAGPIPDGLAGVLVR